jgi:hypothetical protein
VSSGRIEVAHEDVLPGQSILGRWIFRFASALFVAVAVLQLGNALGVVAVGFTNR